MAVALPRRSEVTRNIRGTLQASSLPTDDWRATLEKVEDAMPGLAAYQGHLGKSAQSLLGWFRDYQAAVIPGMQVFVYTSMLSDTTPQPGRLAMRDQARGMLCPLQRGISFAEPEMSQLFHRKDRRIHARRAELENYKHYFDVLRTREGHVRSPEVEALLATVSDPLDLFRAAHAILADG